MALEGAVIHIYLDHSPHNAPVSVDNVSDVFVMVGPRLSPGSASTGDSVQARRHTPGSVGRAAS